MQEKKIFKNKVALITGSSQGIGRAVAREFAFNGAKVVINYPSKSEEENAFELLQDIKSLGGEAICVCADVSDKKEVTILIKKIIKQYKTIDILINNAGIAPGKQLIDYDEEDFDRIFNVNVKSIFLVTKLVLPYMYENNYGKIINTASQHAFSGWPGLTLYTASKGAIISFTRSLAREVGNKNINVNCVAPGGTYTNILEGVPESMINEVVSTIPKKRLAQVQDIVPSYIFLALDENSHFHGQCISPNGGDVMR
ncbi:MAG: 3-oxoacyl-ACP reductase [Rhodospirillaceae bacterium]|nr:3-oxoacyl-ACP reductase [Rhodospirillaceae bacterium]